MGVCGLKQEGTLWLQSSLYGYAMPPLVVPQKTNFPFKLTISPFCLVWWAGHFCAKFFPLVVKRKNANTIWFRRVYQKKCSVLAQKFVDEQKEVRVFFSVCTNLTDHMSIACEICLVICFIINRTWFNNCPQFNLPNVSERKNPVLANGFPCVLKNLVGVWLWMCTIQGCFKSLYCAFSVWWF